LFSRQLTGNRERKRERQANAAINTVHLIESTTAVIEQSNPLSHKIFLPLFPLTQLTLAFPLLPPPSIFEKAIKFYDFFMYSAFTGELTRLSKQRILALSLSRIRPYFIDYFRTSVVCALLFPVPSEFVQCLPACLL
jgi:hypothetical protein